MGMYDEVKYKDKIYQTKSLDCTLGQYEIKNNELWCVQESWNCNGEPYKIYKMSNFFGEIKLHDWDDIEKKIISITLRFIDGNLVNYTDKQLIQNALELLRETVAYYLPENEPKDYVRGYMEAIYYAIKLLTLNGTELQ